MAKNVFIFCGKSSYSEALELHDLLSVAGIGVTLIDRADVNDPARLLKVGRDQAINADAFVIVHSREFETNQPGSADLIEVIDTALSIGTGLFVEIDPFAIFDRWESVAFELNRLHADLRLSEIHRLADQIKSM